MEENPNPMFDQGRMLTWAVFVEGGLGLLAILLGWLTGYNPLELIRLEWSATFGLTLLAVAPMMILFVCVSYIPWKPFRSIRQLLDSIMVPLFGGLTLFELFWMAMLAGVGEELFFRGFLHLWLTEQVGLLGAVLITSILFGLLHWMTAVYAIIATAMGALLSYCMLFSDNLLSSILVHGLYDFLALWLYLRIIHGKSRAGLP
ncbi:MAG: CPBP family intramembrane metalloprotease [Leptospiraceae bacterium]|nr:CPBP family intramembrane metalloprotease [Leptospiraceae bacterium]